MAWDDTGFLLQEWGRWAWQNQGLYLRFPGMSAFRRLSKTSSATSPMISDLAALEIDAAVARVAAANREVRAALIYTHLLRWPPSETASKLQINQRRVHSLIRIGEAAVSEVLDADG